MSWSTQRQWSQSGLSLPPLRPVKPITIASSARGRMDRLDDVRRVAGGGQCPDHVAGPHQGLDLPGEDVAETVVVADGQQVGGIRGQGDRRQGAPLALEPADQLGRDVLGVGRAAAVAEDVDTRVRPRSRQ